MDVTREELRSILFQIGELLQRGDLSRYQVGWQIRWLAEHLWQANEERQQEPVPFSKWYEDWRK